MRSLPRASWTTALAAALFLLAAATPSAARGDETPEQFARKVADATKAADFKTFATLLHPEALADLKKLLREFTVEEPTREIAKMFFGVSTPEEMDKLSGAEVFERFMTTISGQVPNFAEALKSSEIQVLGHIDEKPDLAHVVTRNTAQVGDLKMTKMEVITLRKYGNGWRALLAANIEGVVAQIRQMARKKAATGG